MDRVEDGVLNRHFEDAEVRLESRSDWTAVGTVVVLLAVGIGAVFFMLVALDGGKIKPADLNKSIGNAVYAVMFATLAFALWRMGSLVWDFAREKKLAFEDLQHLWYAAGESVNGFVDQAEKAQRTGLFAQHIMKLHAISRQHGEIDQAVLIEVMHARLSARNKGLEVLGSTLVTMGLIGTIFGLVFLTDGMADVMLKHGASSNVVEGLFAKGSGPMYGLGFAFYTTLLGAFAGGIVLRFFSMWFEARISDFVATIAELTEVNVLPRIRKEREERERQETPLNYTTR